MPARGLLRSLFVSVAAFLALSWSSMSPAASPMLTFHTFVISELYSSPDGQVQFIELRENSNFNFQGSWSGHNIVAFNSDLTDSHTLDFTANLPSTTTAGRRVLIATANFASLSGGITPDYIIPPGFLFPSGRVQFAGLAGGADVSYTSLPATGNQSRNFPGDTDLVNSPTNFAGAAGSVNLPPGSCCVGSTCSVAVQVSCSGAFTAGGSCTPNPCVPAATGACCVGLNCSAQTAAACASSSGQYRGDNVACGQPGNPVACCRANFNQVGGVSVQDIFDFLSAYFSGDLAADFNGAGGVSVQDIFDFLSAYFAACPG
ncbi:MAG: hypothetical protein IT438_04165 [Phycisphaerales bacterium]|nr:hypothetical protein [Phycisphaerales bacterium]